MNKLDIVLMVAEIRYPLLKILHSLIDDDTYDKNQAADELKSVIKNMDSVQYPLE